MHVQIRPELMQSVRDEGTKDHDFQSLEYRARLLSAKYRFSLLEMA